MVKNPLANAGDEDLIPGSEGSPRIRNRQLTPVFWPGESHGQRSLEANRPWGCKESDTTEYTLCY